MKIKMSIVVKIFPAYIKIKYDKKIHTPVMMWKKNLHMSFSSPSVLCFVLEVRLYRGLYRAWHHLSCSLAALRTFNTFEGLRPGNANNPISFLIVLIRSITHCNWWLNIPTTLKLHYTQLWNYTIPNFEITPCLQSPSDTLKTIWCRHKAENRNNILFILTGY